MDESKKECCFYAGDKYSHGAIICVEGERLRCECGRWTSADDASEAHGGDIAATSELETYEPLILAGEDPENAADEIEIENLHEASRYPYSRLRSVHCFRFVRPGGHLADLQNVCGDHRMATIRWVGPNYQEDLSYRIPRGSTRTIRARGQSGSIIAEGDWDLSYGTDVSMNMRIQRENRPGGQVAWLLSNGTNRYVCNKVDIWQNGAYFGYSIGVLAPQVRRRPIFSSMPGTPTVLMIDVARADPQ